MNLRTNTIYGLSLVVVLVLLAAVETVSQTHGMNLQNFATGANKQIILTNLAGKNNQTTGTQRESIPSVDSFTTTQPTSENQYESSFNCWIYISPMPESIKWAVKNNITLNSFSKMTGKFSGISFSWPMFFRLPNKALDFLFGPEVADEDYEIQVVSYKESSGIPALPYKVRAVIIFENLSPTKIDFRQNSARSSVIQTCDTGKAFSSYVPDKMSATLTFEELFASPDYLTAYESYVTGPRGAAFNTILV